MPTSLTVVIPVALRSSSLLNLQATVASVLRSEPRPGRPRLSIQTLVVLDGPDVDGLAGEVPCRVLHSPRPRGGELTPHRNHTRMVGLEHATGELVMVLDADMLLSRHLLHDAAELISNAATPLFLSPCMEALSCTPEFWADRARGYLEGQPLEEAIGGIDTEPLYSGHREHYRPGPPSKRAQKIGEGFPIGRTDILRAVGFSLSYVGWGGNKEDTTMQLGALEPQVSYQLLTSSMAWHQPHRPDPQKNAGDALRRRNQALFTRRSAEVKAGAPWWTHVRASIHDLTHSPKEKTLINRSRILLVCHADEARGIARDMEILAQNIESKPGVPGEAHGMTADIFKVTAENLAALETRVNVKSTDGRLFGDELAHAKTVIFSETVPNAAIRFALKEGTNVRVIPNADWACRNGEVDPFVDHLIELASSSSGFQIWCKTPQWAKTLFDAFKSRDANEKALTSIVHIPWITPEPVTRIRTVNADVPVRFFANLGFGGWKDRRSGKEIVEAWARVHDKISASLTIKAIGSATKTTGHTLERLAELGIKYVGEKQTRGEVMAMLNASDVVLHPSKWEGYGLGISEALNLGIPVITCDAWPMNEHVKHGHNGFLIPQGRRKGATEMRMAPRCHPSPAKLAAAIKELATNHRLRARLSAPQPAARIAQQVEMRLRVKWEVTGEVAPVCMVVIPDGKTRDDVRAEHVWAEALDRLGMVVVAVTAAELATHTYPDAYSFILCSKLPIDQAARLKEMCPSAIFVSWHYDPTEWDAARKRWQTEMAALADHVFFPESEPHRFGAKARTMWQPTRSGIKAAESDMTSLGLIQRPPLVEEFKPGEVVWMGTHTGDDSRTRAVMSLAAEEGTTMIVHGDGWSGKLDGAEGEVPKEKALEVYRGRLALSVSRHVNPRISYTSDRLFNVAGGGTVPLVEKFPGLEDLYPAGTFIPFEGTPAGIVPTVTEEDMIRISDRATQHTWRFHTIEDRILAVLKAITPRADGSGTRALTGCATGTKWDNHAVRAKAKAGSPNMGYVPSKLADFRSTMWRKLQRHLGGSRGTAVDFGTGTGFFAARLKAEGFTTWGLDVSAEMLALAKTHNPGPLYGHMAEIDTVPLGDGSVDVVVVAFVLSDYKAGADLDRVVAKIKAMLKKNGRLLLLERTDGGRTSPSVYEQKFPGLAERETVRLDGQTYSVLAGRLP